MSEQIKSMIKYRLFYSFSVKLVSPLSISSGDGELTDHDIVLSPDDKPFIPGSSVAGALREYIDKKDKCCSWLFGNRIIKDNNEEKDIMSRLFFSDIVLENANISVRDGIALDIKNGLKIIADTAKYDYQVVETGAEGKFNIEIVIYDTDEIENQSEIKPDINYIEKAVRIAVNGINSGAVRFGYKKTRGLGKLNIEETYQKKVFDYSINDKKSVATEYIKFCKNYNYDSAILKSCSDIPDDIAKIKVNLSLKGGISIRTYSAKPEEPDFSHITIGKEKKYAVIPGSSWNGAIRARTFDILKNELGIGEQSTLTEELNKFWGIVKLKDSKRDEFQESKIIFSESIIKDSKPVRMTRNKINRFDSSTIDGALYTEMAYFKGSTELEILIKEYTNYLWAIALVIMVIEDISNGLISVGGQTAIGRGIFTRIGDIEFTNVNEQECNNILLNKIMLLRK